MTDWIFGYGSLIWRADFPFAERRPGYIHGFARRFWQGSTDHRGVPGSPGRVVTLIDAPEAICWGIAYRLHSSVWEETMAHLDHREKGGYERQAVRIHLDDDESVSGLVYHATADNPDYLGEAHPTDIARQILAASGPSGDNREYLLKLEAALRRLDAHDPHVSKIAQALRALE